MITLNSLRSFIENEKRMNTKVRGEGGRGEEVEEMSEKKI